MLFFLSLVNVCMHTCTALHAVFRKGDMYAAVYLWFCDGISAQLLHTRYWTSYRASKLYVVNLSVIEGFIDMSEDWDHHVDEVTAIVFFFFLTPIPPHPLNQY